uniref:ELMO domain-containing protein n=1 Tax=Macrostomum lignano TaxID=282301 RepID=A0A1I8F2J2_9PLAT
SAGAVNAEHQTPTSVSTVSLPARVVLREEPASRRWNSGSLAVSPELKTDATAGVCARRRRRWRRARWRESLACYRRCADRRSAWPTIHAQSVAIATIIRRAISKQTPNKSELSAEKTEAGDDDDGADDEDGGGCSHRLDFNEVGEAGTIGSVVSDLHDALHAFDDKDYQVVCIKPEIDIPLGVLKTLEIVHMQHAWEAFGKGEYRLALSEIGDAVMPQSMEQMVRNARPSTVAPVLTGAVAGYYGYKGRFGYGMRSNFLLTSFLCTSCIRITARYSRNLVKWAAPPCTPALTSIWFSPERDSQAGARG